MIIYLFFALIALILICRSSYFIVMSTFTQNWTNTEGVITTYIVHKGDADNDDELKIKYEYVVDGTKYINNRINYCFQVGESIDNVMFSFRKKKYGLHQIVPVYYNQKKPETSVLEKGHFTANFVFLFIGLVILVAEIFLYR